MGHCGTHIIRPLMSKFSMYNQLTALGNKNFVVTNQSSLFVDGMCLGKTILFSHRLFQIRRAGCPSSIESFILLRLKEFMTSFCLTKSIGHANLLICAFCKCEFVWCVQLPHVSFFSILYRMLFGSEVFFG